MTRKRVSLVAAMLSLGAALSVCTIAARTRASPTLSAWLNNNVGVAGAGENDVKWTDCNTGGGVRIVAWARGWTLNGLACEVDDGSGSTQTTSCSALWNSVDLQQKQWFFPGGPVDPFAGHGSYGQDTQFWGTTAHVNRTLSVGLIRTGQPLVGCGSVNFDAYAQGSN